MKALDPDHATELILDYTDAEGTRTIHFTVDTEQSALVWRRALEGTLFRDARARWRNSQTNRRGSSVKDLHGRSGDDWTMMRCCIPLDRVSIRGVQEYHSFSTLVGLDIDMDPGKSPDEVNWHPEEMAIAERDPIREAGPSSSVRSPGTASPKRRLSERLTWTPRASRSSSPTRPTSRPSSPSATAGIDSKLPPRLAGFRNTGPVYAFNVAVLNERAWFADALVSAVSAAHKRRYKDGFKRPDVIIDVAGFDCLACDEDVDLELSSSNHSADSFDDLNLVQRTRKAETAIMAIRVFALNEMEDIYRMTLTLTWG